MNFQEFQKIVHKDNSDDICCIKDVHKTLTRPKELIELNQEKLKEMLASNLYLTSEGKKWLATLQKEEAKNKGVIEVLAT